MKRQHTPYLRHPKTTQERRSNCDPDHKRYTRGRRRNLPTTYDDIWIKDRKSWKGKRRHQHHDDKSGWEWREFRWDWGDESYQTYRRLFDLIEAGGYWYKSKWQCLRWYGPELLPQR